MANISRCYNAKHMMAIQVQVCTISYFFAFIQSSSRSSICLLGCTVSVLVQDGPKYKGEGEEELEEDGRCSC